MKETKERFSCNNVSFLSPLRQKWKKNWFVLYPASQNGIARLEFFDAPLGGGGGAGAGSVSGSNEKTRKLDKKIIRLSECISILPALTESCPKDNMAAFCVETNDKTHVFAAEKTVSKDWMDTMCDIAFQVFLYLQLFFSSLNKLGVDGWLASLTSLKWKVEGVRLLTPFLCWLNFSALQG